MVLKRRYKTRVRLMRRKLHAANIEFLRIFIKLVPSENQRVFGLTIAIGLICGLVAVAFQLFISTLSAFLIDAAVSTEISWWLVFVIIIPTLGGLISGWMLFKYVPDARGSGIPEVKVAFAVKGGRIPFRVIIGKFFISGFQIATGASLGREGPTVQISSGIASFFGKAAALSRINLTRLLPVGAAAGIAAAFNAPIAAVIFTIEEVVGDLDETILSGVVVAAALAAVVERSVLGEHPVFNVPQNYGLDHASSLFFYGLLGLAAAGISFLFTESLLYLRRKFKEMKKVPVWARPSIGGFMTGVFALIALLFFNTYGVAGGGYDTLTMGLSGDLTLKVMLALCFLKLGATVFSYASGGAGGIFAPVLFIGAMLGGVFGFADIAALGHNEHELGAFALVGMGAVFAGVVRAPITSVVIIFEMTGAYSLILPLMLANAISYLITSRYQPVPIYEALLEQDKIKLPKRDKANKALENILVSQAMQPEPVSLINEMTIGEAVNFVKSKIYSSFPVINKNGRYVGVISESRLRLLLAEGSQDIPISKFLDARPYVLEESTLLDAVERMHNIHRRQIAVVNSKADRRLVGLLSMTDIVLKQTEGKLSDDVEITKMPELAEETETLGATDDVKN
ncbi:MAG: chloride channel protein [Pyrinomonadaceae bacterium]